MSIGSRIKERRLALNLTQEELANRLNISKGAIANYENEVSTPKPDILFNVISILKCDANYLFQDMINQPNNNILTAQEYKIIESYRKLDNRGKELIECVLQKELNIQDKINTTQNITLYHKIYYDFPVSAGTGEYLDDSTAKVVQLNIEPPRGSDYILRIAGDSMEPKYQDGDYIYVHRTNSVEYGDIGIFVYAGNVYMKKYTPEGLESLNPKYDLIKGRNDIRCMGCVLGVVDGSLST